MTKNISLVGQEIKAMFPKYVENIYLNTKDGPNSTIIIETNPSKVVKLINVLKKHTDFQYNILRDISVSDNPEQMYRFSISYHLLSVKFASYIHVKTYAAEDTPVPSITKLHPSADWMEREAWDMFGIYFYNHPNLRRILTDYGFEGHPLRKDFPLSGFVESRYDEESKRVVVEPVELAQEFRTFDFASPWEFDIETEDYLRLKHLTKKEDI